MNLTNEEFEAYWLAITQIEAQDLLVKLRVADFPHMKTGDRKKLHKQMLSLAYAKEERATATTMEDFVKQLSRMTANGGRSSSN